MSNYLEEPYNDKVLDDTNLLNPLEEVDINNRSSYYKWIVWDNIDENERGKATGIDRIPAKHRKHLKLF